jgi:hypothetical protein
MSQHDNLHHTCTFGLSLGQTLATSHRESTYRSFDRCGTHGSREMIHSTPSSPNLFPDKLCERKVKDDSNVARTGGGATNALRLHALEMPQLWKESQGAADGGGPTRTEVAAGSATTKTARARGYAYKGDTLSCLHTQGCTHPLRSRTKGTCHTPKAFKARSQGEGLSERHNALVDGLSLRRSKTLQI